MNVLQRFNAILIQNTVLIWFAVVAIAVLVVTAYAQAWPYDAWVFSTACILCALFIAATYRQAVDESYFSSDAKLTIATILMAGFLLAIIALTIFMGRNLLLLPMVVPIVLVLVEFAIQKLVGWYLKRQSYIAH